MFTWVYPCYPREDRMISYSREKNYNFKSCMLQCAYSHTRGMHTCAFEAMIDECCSIRPSIKNQQ